MKPIETWQRLMPSKEEYSIIVDLQKDFRDTFTKQAGERVLEHLKDITFYHRPSEKKELHLYLQDIVAGNIIDHIHTMLEQPKEVIYNLLNRR